MKKTTKIWIITAISLIIIGCMIFGGVMTVLKWDFKKLSTAKFEKNSYTFENEIKNISLITDTADVTFIASANGKATVECYEESNAPHSVSLEDGKLRVELKDDRKWFEHVGINIGTPKITVTLPEGEYGTLSIESSTGDTEIPDSFFFESVDIKASTGNVSLFAGAEKDINIKLSTGHIDIKNISAENLDLTVSTGHINVENIDISKDINVKVSTGKAKLTNVSCKALISTGNTGDITLSGVIADENLSIERSTGDITFERCDSHDITVITDTGDVFGTLLSDKIFITKTATGDVNVPASEAGGKCEITTDTGDIEIKIEG